MLAAVSSGAVADPQRSPRLSPLSDEELDRLLEKTSRTFALSIPLLPDPTRREVGLAYLLFRIADTLEDAETWPAARQVEALHAFAELMLEPDLAEAERQAAGWLTDPPVEHEGYLELLAATPQVVASFLELSPDARHLIGHHTARTSRGMAGFVGRKEETGGTLQLADLDDLRAYCYVVAGIVGEMLTALFLLGREILEPLTVFLEKRAAAFGEALQLVNILKDSAGDEVHGRNFLPTQVARAEVFALAREDLRSAGEYVRRLQEVGAPRGLVAFIALPVRMAAASLDRVEEAGPGAKLTRPEVYRIVEEVHGALESGAPAA